jgi:hypothetical protein
MSTTMPATKPTTMPATKPTPDPTPNHEIKITLEGGYGSGMPDMKVGETVRYSSNPPGSGEITVQFPKRSPFREDNVTGTEVPGAVILTLVSDSGGGTLPCAYFITPPGGSRQTIPDYDAGTKVTRP